MHEEPCTFNVIPTLYALVLSWVTGADSCTKCSDFLWDNGEKLYEMLPAMIDKPPLINNDVSLLIKLVKLNKLLPILADFSKEVEFMQDYGKEELLKKISALADNYSHSGKNYLYCADSCILNLGRSCVSFIQHQNIPFDMYAKKGILTKMLNVLNIRGAVCKVDAHHISNMLCSVLIEAGADYIIEMEPSMASYNSAVEIFKDPKVIDELAETAETEPYDEYHFKIKPRKIIAAPSSLLGAEAADYWGKDVQTILCEPALDENGEELSSEEGRHRYYASSLSFEEPDIAEYALNIIRENSLFSKDYNLIWDLYFGPYKSLNRNRDYVENAKILNKLKDSTQQIAAMIYGKDKKVSVKDMPEILQADLPFASRCLSMCLRTLQMTGKLNLGD